MSRAHDEIPCGLSDDELNLRLAMRFRSCADAAFIRGEKP